jgi:mannose-6-phosphate isomerase
MLYPFKFIPAYKDYIWGGRNLEKFGKVLPDGIIAEIWEISSHADGVSVVANGEYKGTPLTELLMKLGRKLVGNLLEEKDVKKFPLLVKLIDANDKLSVQVHPGDDYAKVHENGELGKNEMWYILSAKPGAKLIYDVKPGVNKDSFAKAVADNKIEDCLKQVEVFAGDSIDIPEGLVHAIGEGIVLAEIQQNSNTTYRVYDYNRTDKNGNSRPLHIEKALDVIDFNSQNRKEKCTGLTVSLGPNMHKTFLIANKYFSVELYDINGKLNENADGSKFYIYVFTEGEAIINYQSGSEKLKAGESVLIPACLGNYSVEGSFKMLKSYVPDLHKDIISQLSGFGFTSEEIYCKVSGLKKYSF